MLLASHEATPGVSCHVRCENRPSIFHMAYKASGVLYYFVIG